VKRIYSAAWKYYISRYRGHYGAITLAMALSFVQLALVLPIVFLVRYVFDTVIPGGDFRLLVIAGAAMFLLNLANGGVSLWVRYVTLRTTKIVIREIRNDLLNRLYTFSRSFYGSADRGSLHNNIVQDTERLDVMSNALVANLLPAALIGAALFGFLLYLNWFLVLIMLLVVPFLFLANHSLGRRVKVKVNAFRRSFEAFSKGILFVLQAMDLTRTQTAEVFEAERQRQRLEELRIASGSMAWLDTAYTLVQTNLSAVSSILILIGGGSAVASGSMSLGELLSFYVTVSLLNQYFKTCLTGVPQLILGNESLNTLFEVLRTGEEQPYSGQKKIDFRGKVTFEAVRFGYGQETVLAGVDLTIEPQTTIAIMGANGSGKSTMMHLLSGFYRPQQGRLLADGVPYDELDIVELRRTIGVVMQDPFFFPGSILENITYGSPGAKQGEVMEAADLATAHAFIEELPRGYDTLVGENGVLLSGGQRQRIAIARALLRRPTLLILDEPTNHLDAMAVARLIENLQKLPYRPTVILISHDPEIVHHADQIYLLEGGILKPRTRERQPAVSDASLRQGSRSE
jgi:ABC-type bacteriocin/lantibiotic exporter with double-glycine peptidase domain